MPSKKDKIAKAQITDEEAIAREHAFASLLYLNRVYHFSPAYTYTRQESPGRL